ncbi:LysR family transcriptional regulator [Pragia fontium]|uniref:LysR family transcriptional regulator n=1 Tax=Pragia fontium TaxID=82985 RepID=UPI000F6F6259|nr:LysR family transcriptional regulator [Pragia fontium]VEJ52831.1 D-malate degradation protein R [Pragia fontium]
MNPNISLKQLQIFTKVVYYGGISEAAAKMNLSASAVSKSLSLLEANLGVQLIQRTTRNTSTTKVGDEFYAKIVKILADLEDSVDTVSYDNNEPRGEIRVTCSLALGTAHLMHIFSEYRKKYSKVRLIVDLSDKFVNLNEGQFDLALRIVKRPPENYAMRELAPINWVYCASAEYLKKRGVPASIRDLKDHDCLVYPGIESAWYYLDDNGEKQLVKSQQEPIQANSSLVLLEAALRSQGIAYLPTYLLGKHIENGDLIPLLKPNLGNGGHHLYALYVPCRYVDYNIRTFVDFIYDWVNPVPWDNWTSVNKR